MFGLAEQQVGKKTSIAVKPFVTSTRSPPPHHHHHLLSLSPSLHPFLRQAGRSVGVMTANQGQCLPSVTVGTGALDSNANITALCDPPGGRLVQLAAA